MKHQLLPCNNRGTILMLVVVSAFIMSIVGLGSINLMGMQEIQARAELDVVRAGHLADAGVEMARVWISSECVRFKDKQFPENVNSNSNPIFVGRHVVGSVGDDGEPKAYFEVSIIPLPENTQTGFIVPTASINSNKGSYIISSTGTIAAGGMTTSQHKSVYVQMKRTVGHELVDPMPNIAGSSVSGKRGSQTNTLLFNGRVLIAGGDDSDLIGDDALGTHTLQSALLYNPETETYTRTGNMFCPREKHTATALTLAPGHPLAGQILIVGGAVFDSAANAGAGYTFSDGACRRAEIYDPVAGTFNSIAGPGGLIAAGGRNCHTATMLLNGRVLIAGGVVNEVEQVLRTGEVFDPGPAAMPNPQFIPVGTPGNGDLMSVGRHCFTSVLLNNGQVLLAGGDDNGWPAYQCDLYNPDTNRFIPAKRMQYARHDHAAVKLDDGRVLVVGGFSDEGSGPSSFYGCTNTAEIFDPKTGKWDWTMTTDGKKTQTKMKNRRGDLFCFKLPGGKVLIAGGCYYPDNEPGDMLASDAAEVYDPITGEFEEIDPMFTARRAENNPAVALRNGDIFLFGGWNGEDIQHSSNRAESYPSEIEAKKKINSYNEGPATRGVE